MSGNGAIDDDEFPIFAAWARERGIEDAAHRFKRMLGDHLESYVAEFERRMREAEAGQPSGMFGVRESWYPGPLDTDTYWPKLEQYFLKQLDWAGDQVHTVDHSSTKVVAYTPDPRQDRFAAKGLVVGYVQSGKTTNFTSVIAKAADCGYRLIVVLSGIHNGLRRQTQERLDSQLKDLNDTRWFTLTLPNRDFYPPAIGAPALLQSEKKINLAVVKKNKAVLKRLVNWLDDAMERNLLADVPVLIIDDEADQASVATKAINPLIRSIIDRVPRCTYIGYTATPFANILIDPAAGDLYPERFILTLPKPEGYFGTERIFGREEVEGDEASGSDLDGYDMVRKIPDTELDDLRPAGKAASAEFKPSITDSLLAAVRWFWIATAARRARGDHGHSTMLIHTSMKTAVHESYRHPLVNLRDTTLEQVRAGDEALLAELRAQWDDETTRVPGTEFDDVPTITFDDLRTQLVQTIESTKVILDNCRSDDRLDYSTPGQIAIAVGGNTLSRGLTLEGLVVSFFVRAAQAYDTLLQMARWFGFRGGYEDLPRIWMTDQLKEWFRHLATVEHEIRLDIDRYEREGLTPLDFGVRIRTHPVLRITAKMGAYKPAYASYGGRRVQTRYYREEDRIWLDNNVEAAGILVTAARAMSPETRLISGASLYRQVDWEYVQRFLRSYRVHPDSPDLDAELIIRYVEKQLGYKSLASWNIAVMGGMEALNGTVRLGGVEFNRIQRSKLKQTGPERADTKTLMSKDHRVVDLDIEPARAREMSEDALMTARDADPVRCNQGLLLLYPIDPQSKPESANVKSRSPLAAVADVIGMALVFPGNAEDKSSVASTYIAVDLSGAEVEVSEDELDALEGAGDE